MVLLHRKLHIKAGAFDGLGANRRQMMMHYLSLIDSAAEMSRVNIEGQMGLFSDNNSISGVFEKFKPMEEFRYVDLLCFEKFATGMYISGHPTDPYRYALKLMRIPEIKVITENLKQRKYGNGIAVCMCGVMDDLSVRYTSTGRKMGFLSIQDSSGFAECTVFPDTFLQCEKKLEYGNVLFISGKISVKPKYNDSFVAERIYDENEFEKILLNKRLCIKIQSNEKDKITKISELFVENLGKNQVCFYISDMKKFVKPKNISGVLVNNMIYDELSAVTGENTLGFID